jgi:tRNA (guanine37-N1)-methyltransferase
VIFHLLTLFPEFFRGPFDFGVVARARQKGLLEIRIHDLRDWTSDRHKTVDDRPFGGGEGMVLKPEPIFAAVESIFPERTPDQRVVLLSAQGRLFHQREAANLAGTREILLICGRYEGVDERVAEHLADDELCIGDYVLSGGELAAAVVVDVVARLIPGVLGNQASAFRESFTAEPGQLPILDCPHYTRPADFRGWPVPDVLLSGHHDEIRKWRAAKALEKTRRLRPDLAAALPGPDSPARKGGETPKPPRP